MNIAVFAKRTTFHSGHGGLETQNKALLEGLAARGHSITLFSPKWEVVNSDATANGIRYVFVDCVYRMGPVFGFFGTMQKNNWINRSVEVFSKYHSKEKFDLVIGQSSTALGVIKSKEEFNIKIISISHGTIIGEYKSFISGMSLPKDSLSFIKNTGFTIKNFFRRQRDFVHGSDKIVCVSNYVKNALIEETFAPDDKFAVIHNGINNEKFDKTPVKRGKKCLFVGRVIKDKGADIILDIFKDPRFSDFKVDVVGEGDYLAEMTLRVNSNRDLQSKVNLIGKVSYDELISKYYLNADYGLFLMPTRRIEGFPMVLVEALFSGIPVVAFSLGGVSDAVIDSKTGYLVDSNSLEDYKLKMLDILNNESLKLAMSNESIKLAKEEFTINKMVDLYEQVINEVLK